MRYLLHFVLMGFLFGGAVLAQNENKRWVFGGAPFPTNPPSLDFNSGVPVGVSNVPVPAYYSGEAAASVADRATGSLLFYTDGEKVFTAGNVAMPNGGAVFTTDLSGCNSSTQGALILPRPGMPNHYYLFTVDCTERFTSPSYSGLQYSEVDMTLNGGMGDIIAGNRNLYLWGPPTTNKLTEKLTAVRHPNGNDYWVVAHEWGTNQFLSFAVTCGGVASVPVISGVGTVHTSGSAFPNEVIGAMKISPDRTRLALVAQGALNLIEVFNFDATTGMVSAPITLPGNGSNDYGLEFSPNSQRLYVTVYDPSPCCSSTIFQYNLAAGTQAAIQSSKVQIATSGTFGYGGMQLGPDNKIYISRVLQTNTLAVISSPNNLGSACAFYNSGPTLLTRRSNIGLINLVPFQVAEVCLPLATDLLYFQATRLANGELELQWEAASAYNVDHYVLEQSMDGESFSGIATIDSRGDEGASLKYSQSVRSSVEPVYYRLRQINVDGDYTFSKVLFVRPGNGGAISVHFDENASLIKLKFPEGMSESTINVRLRNIHGTIILRESFSHGSSSEVQLSVPANIAKGIYFLQVSDLHEQPLFTRKVVI
jgi:hypothetical protein